MFALRYFFLSLLIPICLPFSAFAQTDIFVRGSGKLFPIAVPQLCLSEGQSEAQKEMAEVLAYDLTLSGYFEVLNAGMYIENAGKCQARDGFAYSDWSVIGAEGLVKGIVQERGGALRVQLFLHDVQRQRVVLGKEYTGDASQVRLMAHKFANEVIKFFTGELGIFGTPIVYAGRVGRFKELYYLTLGDQIPRQLTNDSSLSVSPQWAPDGKSIAFTSYRKRVPDLFTMDILSRKSRQITSNSAMELGAKLSRGGQSFLLSLTEGRDSDLVLMSPSGQITRKLTAANGAIDVSPDWSPDESKVAFCSNRAGGPQIYVMNSDGSDPHRVSFVSSNYCTSPDWSPKGDKLAFVCRVYGYFQIFVSNVDGTNPIQLTGEGDNEDPDWSPDGRYLIFSSTFGKKGPSGLAIMREDGSNPRQLTNGRGGGDGEPSFAAAVP